MLRTFNYTNRARILQKEVEIKLEEDENGAPRIHAEMRFDTSQFPGDAFVYVEAYYRETRQRFDFGTIASIRPVNGSTITQVDLSGPTLFRVLIIDETGLHALILGFGEGFRAFGQDSDEENRSGILTVNAKPLRGLAWRVEFAEGEKPELVMNNRIPNAIEKMRSDPVFQALVLPMALRDVLTHYLLNDDVDDESDIACQWKAFAFQFTDQDPDTIEDSEKSAWLDSVVEEFAHRFELGNRIADVFKEEE